MRALGALVLLPVDAEEAVEFFFEGFGLADGEVELWRICQVSDLLF